MRPASPAPSARTAPRAPTVRAGLGAAALALGAAALALGAAGPARGEGHAAGARAAPSATRGNAIDAVVLPLLRRAGLEATRERDDVLCRRMAIDLTGVPPTREERAGVCVGRSPEALAAYFMDKPSAAHVPDGSAPYVFVNRRRWADAFQYRADLNESTTWWRYVRELDALVGDLYAGRIGYDAFTRRALASPAFLRRFGIFDRNHDLVQLAAQAVRVFLGREALPPEAEELGNLFRAWDTIHVDHAVAIRRTPADCPRDVPGKSDPCQHVELGVRGDVCAGLAAVTCRAGLLTRPGAPPVEVAPADPVLRNVDELPPAERARLERVGDLFVARREWAEAAVDRALTTYLGWWRRGVFVPDFELPPVREALVDTLIRDRYDLRRLDREIVTSVLYTAQAALPAGERPDVPLWAVGPTKLVPAEAYLDLVVRATGKPVGGCDFRFTALTSGSSFLPGFWYPQGVLADFGYATLALGLGGCPNATAHQEPTGIVAAITRRTVAARACPGAFRPQPGASLEALIDDELSVFGAAAAPADAALLARALRAAGHDVASQAAADQLCQALLSSSLVVTY